MAIWALADLHLSFGVPNKEMDLFGEQWKGHAASIQKNWIANINPSDLVLIPGDISWAMRLDEVQPDLEWIHNLPGTKVILKGNHDYWWGSLGQIKKILPPSIHLIQNNVFHWNDVSIVGARLWDTPEYNFSSFIEYRENPKAQILTAREKDPDEAERIFLRELGRLELSLKCLDARGPIRIAMTHYPPIGTDLKESRASSLLEKYNINTCVFGHLHSVKKGIPLFGKKNGIRYLLTSCDYLDFQPLKIFD